MFLKAAQWCFHIDSAMSLHVYHAAVKLHAGLLLAAHTVDSGQHKQHVLLCVPYLKNGNNIGPAPTMTESVVAET